MDILTFTPIEVLILAACAGLFLAAVLIGSYEQSFNRGVKWRRIKTQRYLAEVNDRIDGKLAAKHGVTVTEFRRVLNGEVK